MPAIGDAFGTGAVRLLHHREFALVSGEERERDSLHVRDLNFVGVVLVGLDHESDSRSLSWVTRSASVPLRATGGDPTRGRRLDGLRFSG